jgi:hypothetical protein
MWVDVNLKLVLIASVDAYCAVQVIEPEFAQRFRFKVDFAESFKAPAQTVQANAVYMKHPRDGLGLLHFSALAAAACVKTVSAQRRIQRVKAP